MKLSLRRGGAGGLAERRVLMRCLLKRGRSGDSGPDEVAESYGERRREAACDLENLSMPFDVIPGNFSNRSLVSE